MAHLVVLAAGMGSRFGGDKQLAEFGQEQLTLMEYNIAHAHQAGFREVTLIIRESISALIDKRVLPRLPKPLKVNIVCQKLTDTPIDNPILIKRNKPLGTAHALWCAREYLEEKFAVINADDYYGSTVFDLLFEEANRDRGDYLLVAFPLEKTLSAHGGVNRGICEVNDDNKLVGIVEVEDIKQDSDGYTGWYSSAGKQFERKLEEDQLVSMNCWLFSPKILPAIKHALMELLTKAEFSLSSECYLPSVVMSQICNENQPVRVSCTHEQWFGITYAQDTLLIDECISKISLN